MTIPVGAAPAAGAEDAPRWLDYLLERGAGVRDFWREHLAERERQVLFVLGRGFDPRMCNGLESLLLAGAGGRCDLLAVALDEGEGSSSRVHTDRAERNWALLQRLAAGGAIREQRIPMRSEGRRVGARHAVRVLGHTGTLERYTDIVVDISALPRSIYFPLIAGALHTCDAMAARGIHPPNLHVLVSEAPAIDRSIKDEGVEDNADYVHPFGGLEREALGDQPMIWIPLLGEDQAAQLASIEELVDPDEISPVLPSPSTDPRRGDNLVLEYRQLLFDKLRVEPANFIYASEVNPFEVYRQVRKAVFQYSEALEPLGRCRVTLSALSSKLMSIGALLVAYELKALHMPVGVAHVETQGYRFEEDSLGESARTHEAELFGLWLAGECYER